LKKDIGLNIWDTANTYSNRLSEKFIGKAIKTFDIPRHKLVLMTKCFHAVGEEINFIDAEYPEMRNTKDYINQYGKYYSTDHTMIARTDWPYWTLACCHLQRC
jgi:aryl-alcohol dehydrogenase-like predicted oxidoreductase